MRESTVRLRTRTMSKTSSKPSVTSSPTVSLVICLVDGEVGDSGEVRTFGATSLWNLKKLQKARRRPSNSRATKSVRHARDRVENRVHREKHVGDAADVVRSFSPRGSCESRRRAR